SAAGPLVIAGVPHFHPPSALPMVRLLESATTHPWGGRSKQLMSELTPGELFLDFGCGIKRADELAENAVLLDAIHFSNVDVVSPTGSVPFRDETFALILSQAVFEHLPDPFHTAREMLRILKPGGRILIDTAFMQPFHADPDHYFNMTSEGLRTIM